MSGHYDCPNCGKDLEGEPIKNTLTNGEQAKSVGDMFVIQDGQLALTATLNCPSCEYFDERVWFGSEVGDI